MGAWIEIGSGKAGGARGNTVAPLVGAWIEILEELTQRVDILSLLSWERGLKLIQI